MEELILRDHHHQTTVNHYNDATNQTTPSSGYDTGDDDSYADSPTSKEFNDMTEFYERDRVSSFNLHQILKPRMHKRDTPATFRSNLPTWDYSFWDRSHRERIGDKEKNECQSS